MFLLWLDKGHDDHKGLTLETPPYDVAKNYMQFLMIRLTIIRQSIPMTIEEDLCDKTKIKLIKHFY